MVEDDAADEEDLSQVAQAEFVPQTPRHHEGDDVGGLQGSVQQPQAAFVELLAAAATPEPAVALGGALRPFRNG
jgi:hypothetical protein